MDPASIIGLLLNIKDAVQCLAGVAEIIKDAPQSLAAVVDEARRFGMQLDHLFGIQRGLAEEQKRYLDKQVSTEECRLTIIELNDLILKIKPTEGGDSDKGNAMKWTERIKWLLKKGNVERLTEKLANQTERTRKLLLSEQILKLNIDMGRVLEALSCMKPVTTAPAKFDINGIFSPYSASSITWYGQIRYKPNQSSALPHFGARALLADAVYRGCWDKMKTLLPKSREGHHQVWVNCWRILPSTETVKIPSGFTPLHQAAWWGNKEVVQELLQIGAWRLSRTLSDTSHSKKYSTPLDIARDHGWEHLYELLSPVIRRPVNHKILQTLQDRLHDLIRQTFRSNAQAHLECFVLPELEILTEFEHSRMWFPLNPELPDTRDGLAVHIILDRNELVATMRWGRNARKNYRISSSGIQEVRQAVVLH